MGQNPSGVRRSLAGVKFQVDGVMAVLAARRRTNHARMVQVNSRAIADKQKNSAANPSVFATAWTPEKAGAIAIAEKACRVVAERIKKELKKARKRPMGFSERSNDQTQKNKNINRNNTSHRMAKKTVDWLKKSMDGMIQQFDQFTLKVGSYQVLLSLTPEQITAIRNDFLWADYAVRIALQFEQETKNRFDWRDTLLTGPATSVAMQVPSIGTEFAPPAPAPVADGILSRWRQLTEQIKNHPKYTTAIGMDLGIEATEAPAQATKPRFRSGTEVGGKLQFNLLMDGHDAVAVKCQRGAEPEPTLLGVFTRSKIEDDRPNLVPGQPELRKYIAEYRDADKPVGQPSDMFIITKQP